MTERERWVVYPLLFLALGAALRDKLVDRTTTKSIVCQELSIVEDEPVGNQPVRVLAKIGRTEARPNAPASGFLVVNGAIAVNGEVAVDGIVKVNGVVNAKQYAYQGMLFMPSFQAVPGVPAPTLQAAPGRGPQNAHDIQSPGSQPQGKPPEESPDSSANDQPSKSNSNDSATPKK
jgi:hypothetical protein